MKLLSNKDIYNVFGASIRIDCAQDRQDKGIEITNGDVLWFVEQNELNGKVSKIGLASDNILFINSEMSSPMSVESIFSLNFPYQVINNGRRYIFS